MKERRKEERVGRGEGTTGNRRQVQLHSDDVVKEARRKGDSWELGEEGSNWSWGKRQLGSEKVARREISECGHGPERVCEGGGNRERCDWTDGEEHTGGASGRRVTKHRRTKKVPRSVAASAERCLSLLQCP